MAGSGGTAYIAEVIPIMNAVNGRPRTNPRRSFILRTSRYVIRSRAKVSPCAASGGTAAVRVEIANAKSIDSETAAVAARGKAHVTEESSKENKTKRKMIPVRKATDVRNETANAIMIKTGDRNSTNSERYTALK